MPWTADARPTAAAGLRIRPSGALLVFFVVLGGPACTGDIIGDPGSSPRGDREDISSGAPGGPASNSSPTGGGAAGTSSSPKTAPGTPLVDGVSPGTIRLLSTQELANALQAVLGFRPASLSRLPGDTRTNLFDRIAQDQTISPIQIEAFSAIADEIADWLTPTRLGALVKTCATTQSLGTDGTALAKSRRPCVQSFIEQVGRRAFRRAVAPARVADWLAIYDGAGTYADGLRLAVHGIFQAPEFLYVIEFGTPVPGKPGVFALTDEEIATRLSLSLCETIPDAALLDAAQAGQLRQPEQIAAQAARLFDQSCAQNTVGKFFSQWFKADSIRSASRDPKQFPMFTDAAREGIVAEQEQFIKEVLWRMNGRLPDLFAANFGFVHSSAALYGVTGIPIGKLQRVDFPSYRRGILTRPLFLITTTTANTTSPTVRGVAVLTSVLCQHLPPPPDDVPPKKDDGVTQPRTLAEKHASDPACAGCHRIIDPVGYAMEDFDAIGRYRTTDRGTAVNPLGGIPSLGFDNGTIRGAGELSVAVSALPALSSCFAAQWFRFGMGRLEGEEDAKSLADLADGLRRDGVSLKDAMIGLTRTYAFTHRAVIR
jgi:hypothetical protein